VGDAFRERCRMFPGLVNCTTIDWFTAWPADALFEVASRRLADEAALPAIIGAEGAEPARAAAARLLVAAHQSVEDGAARMWAALRRRVYVTPTHFLECVSNYAALLGEKRAELAGNAGKLQGGLLRLDETRGQVAEMQGVAAAKAAVVAQAKADCEELLVAIVQVGAQRGGRGSGAVQQGTWPPARTSPACWQCGGLVQSPWLPPAAPNPASLSLARPNHRTSARRTSRRSRSTRRPPRSRGRPTRLTPSHSRHGTRQGAVF
jgi:hypothetical protein